MYICVVFRGAAGQDTGDHKGAAELFWSAKEYASALNIMGSYGNAASVLNPAPWGCGLRVFPCLLCHLTPHCLTASFCGVVWCRVGWMDDLIAKVRSNKLQRKELEVVGRSRWLSSYLVFVQCATLQLMSIHMSYAGCLIFPQTQSIRLRC